MKASKLAEILMQMPDLEVLFEDLDMGHYVQIDEVAVMSLRSKSDGVWSDGGDGEEEEFICIS